jgi:Ca-activated chloride channel homolog
MTMKRVALALLFSSILSVSALAEGQRVILVLDASGSMRGKVDGKMKMDIAKQVVGKVLKTWNPEDDLGLVVYGHREKDNCSDIETVLPPGPLTIGEYMSPVKGLKPKGKTPMTQAVRQAAEALKYTEQKSTVILVSDGEETCEADPCAVARELEQAGIGFTVHTVGFGLDKGKATEQLKCMAEETGGIAVLAGNAEELESAFKKTVEAKVEEPPPPALPEYNFMGHVVMAPGVELPEKWSQPAWTFATSQNGEMGEDLGTDYGRDMNKNLERYGDLLVNVSTDYAFTRVPFALAQGGSTKLDVNLNAGIVKFKGMMDESTPVTDDGASWTFSGGESQAKGTVYGVAPQHLLNAGDYTLNFRVGTAEMQMPFKVEAGKVNDVVATLGAGAVLIHATYSPGGEVLPGANTTMELAKPAGIDGEEKRVTTNYGNDLVFKALAGDYVMIVSMGLASAKVPIKIMPGQEAKVDVNLDAGFIAATAAGVTSYSIYEGKKSLDGEYKRLTTTYEPEFKMAANTGTYLLRAYNGDALIGEKLIEVKAGERTEITIP